MSLNAPDYSYLGSGEVHLRKKGAAAPFRSIGNCSAFSFSPQSNNIALANSTTPGGGTRNTVPRVTSVPYAISMTDFSVENLADVLRGTVETIAAGTATGEDVVAYPGGVTPLAYIATAITSVKSQDGTTTYVAGTDYDLKNGALYVYEDGDIPAPVSGAANIKVTYTYGAAKKLQALVNKAEEYELMFLGFNEARSGKRVKAHAFRVSGGVLAQLSMVGDAHGVGEVSGELMVDTTRPAYDPNNPGNPYSQWFTWEQEE